MKRFPRPPLPGRNLFGSDISFGCHFHPLFHLDVTGVPYHWDLAFFDLYCWCHSHLNDQTPIHHARTDSLCHLPSQSPFKNPQTDDLYPVPRTDSDATGDICHMPLCLYLQVRIPVILGLPFEALEGNQYDPSTCLGKVYQRAKIQPRYPSMDR